MLCQHQHIQYSETQLWLTFQIDIVQPSDLFYVLYRGYYGSKEYMQRNSFSLLNSL